MLSFTIPGTPVPKGRPIVGRVGPHVRLRTPPETMTFENWVRACAIEAMRGSIAYPLDCPVVVSLRFVLARPASRAKLETLPDRKPDLDNLEKAVLDGMGLARVYVNDSRIVELVSRKVYGSPERVEVEVAPAVVAVASEQPTRPHRRPQEGRTGLGATRG